MSYEIDYDLLAVLATRTHPLLNIADDWHQQVLETPEAWIGEVLFQARSVHHLLDMAQIPRGTGYASDLDSRTYLAVMELIDRRREQGV
jgi:hypothetical protein